MIDIKKLYEDKYNKISINEDIAILNCDIMILIKKIILDVAVEENDFLMLYKQFIKITKFTIEQTHDRTIESVSKNINELSNDIIEEYQNVNNKIKLICHLLGTCTEFDKCYTIHERMIIITALAKMKGIQFNFDF